MKVLISSETANFLGRSDGDLELDNIVLHVPYQELYHCRTIPMGKAHLLCIVYLGDKNAKKI